MDEKLRFPQDSFKLLHWLFFKPFTLRRYVRQIDERLDEDLKLWDAKQHLPDSLQLVHMRRLVNFWLVAGPVGISLFVGLVLLLFHHILLVQI